MKNNFAAIIIPAAILIGVAAAPNPPTAGVISSPASGPSSTSDDVSGASDTELWDLRDYQVAAESDKHHHAATVSQLEKELATTKMQLLALQEQERLRNERVAKGECLCGEHCACKKPVAQAAPVPQPAPQRPTFTPAYYQPTQYYGSFGPGGCSPGSFRVFGGRR